MSLNIREAIVTAFQFAQALAQRDYALAYTQMTLEYQGNMSLSELQEAFEFIIPHDWGDVGLSGPEDYDDPYEDEMLQDWPDKQPSDIGWIYIALIGEKYPWSEGLYILISHEGPSLKVRDVEFGRP
jgi:hypothetical protein